MIVEVDLQSYPMHEVSDRNWQPNVMNANSAKKKLRHYARVPAQLEATVSINTASASPTNNVTSAIANLSRAGMMLACNRATLEQILPNTTLITPRKPVQLDIAFTLPTTTTQPVRIKATCSIIYTRRTSRDAFQVGVEFVSVENNDYNYLDQYIETLQQAG